MISVQAYGNVVHRGPAGHLYEEIFGLIHEGRECLAVGRILGGPNTGATYVIETTRLTARLLDMAAWALGLKAVEHGEMDLEAFETCFGLDALPAHLAPITETDRHLLPSTVTSLLDRSLNLYQRVARLDRMARRRAGTAKTDTVPRLPPM